MLNFLIFSYLSAFKIRIQVLLHSAGARNSTIQAVLGSQQGYFNGWMDDLRFYILFNSISVISGQCLDDNEILCAMELYLRLRRFHLE